MKKNIKILKFCLGLALMCLGGQFLCQKTYASCYDGTWDNNPSIKRACGYEGTRGIMWISSSSDPYDISSEIRVDNWMDGDGRVKVYLHGAVFEGEGAATYIKFVKSDQTIIGTTAGYESYAPLSGVPFALSRPYNSRSGKTFVSSVYPVYLDINKMVEEEGNSYQEENGRKKYTINLQAFRCFVGAWPYVGNDSCYSDTSPLIVSVRGDSTFEGYSEVIYNGGQGANTNWQSSGTAKDNTAWLELKDQCNDGCNVTFTHGLKRTQGQDESNWSVSGNGSGSGSSNGKDPLTTSMAKIYTGQSVCSTLKFDSRIENGKSTATAYTRACVYATGTYGENDSSAINLEVRKNNGGWTESDIYVKPGDVAHFKGTYTPKVQQAYNITSQKTLTVYEDGTWKCKVTNVGTSSVRAMLASASCGRVWKNAFSIYLEQNTATFNEFAVSNTIGATGAYDNITKKLDNSYTVGRSDPGRAIVAQAGTNHMNETKTAPRSVTFVFDKNTEKFAATMEIAAIYDSAKILVPYNFTNTTTVTTNENAIVYAGESKTFEFEIKVGTRENRTTEGTYATIVPRAKWRMKLCYYSDGKEICYDTDENQALAQGALNANGNLAGETVNKQMTLNIPDVPAGTEVCVRSGVYPASSGADTNYENIDGDGQWAWSAKKCFVVAKKPSLQVWGGNIYSNGIINTARAIKNNLAGYNDRGYTIENNSTTTKTAFGSWSELGVISNGLVSGLASGASVGYGANDNGTLSPPLEGIVGLSSTVSAGGSTKTDYCKQVPLSFANSKCTSNYTGQLGSAITSSSIKGDQSNILMKFDYGGTMNSDGVTALNDGNKIQKETYYYYGTKLTLGGQTNAGGNPVQRGSIQFVHGTEGIYINGNLEYQDGYTKLADVPKLIIYTEKNINIACNVSRIDAILIAGGTVNTCADENGDSPEVNSAERSQQLMINGAVVAAKLEAKRTYGAGPGVNSGVPAEILNFDPTLYRFGEIQSSNEDAGESFETTTNLDTVYQKELAPRA